MKITGVTAAVVGIGETLIRCTPSGGETLESAPVFTAHVAGAESNVCANLARLGVATAWISRLPRNPLGRHIASAIRGRGVDTGGVLWTPAGRVGLLLVQPAVTPRPGEVLYYRRNSAFAQIDPDAVEWERLAGAGVVHLTGITPALGDGPRRLVLRSIEEARRRGARISFDVNYRATLWPPEAARATLEPLLRGLDIVFVNDRDARTVFGADGDAPSVAAALRGRFGCDVLVLTLGAHGALAQDGAGAHRVPAHPVDVVDRIGRGDAFAAGFLYGSLRRGTADGLRTGAALAALKQTHSGDMCDATMDEVEALLQGGPGTLHR